MSELSSSNWSETDASNTVTPPAGWPAGMTPNNVEPTARGMMGAIKRFWNRINPTYTSGGSAGAYTFTPTNTSDPTAYVQGEIYTFKANFTSVGADTLNVNSLGALGIYKPTGSGPLAIAAGDIQNNTMVSCAYDSALNGGGGGFQLIAGQVTFSGSAAIAAPNKLINSFMEIDQANEGSATTLTHTANLYAIDGWRGVITDTGSTAVATVQRVTDAPTGYPNSIKYTVTTAGSSVASGSYMTIGQNIEADNLIDTAFGTANAQSVTLTFWIKSSVSGTYCGSLQNYNGSSVTRSYPFNFVLSSANTWTKFTQTITGDTSGTWSTSGNTPGLAFGITLAAGSTFQNTANTWASGNYNSTSSISNTIFTTLNATFQLGPCKLEIGSVATPLIRDSFQQELARCQRYYEKSYNLGTALASITTVGEIEWIGISGQFAPIPVYFKVSKRITPTLTMYSPSSGSSGVIYNLTGSADITASVNGSGMGGVNVGPATTLGSTVVITAHWTSDARL